MRQRRRIAAGLAACAAGMAIPAALGATPESATVSAGSPSATWRGHVSEPTAFYEIIAFFAGGTHGACPPDACDMFTLDVDYAGSGLLHLAVDAKDAEQLAFEVVDPAGNTTYVDDVMGARHRETDLPLKSGRWRITTLGARDFDYTGVAEIRPTVSGPPATTTTTTAAAPAPTPTPRLSIATPKRSTLTAKRLRRGKRLTVALRTTAPLTKVVAGLVKGERVLASAQRSRVGSRVTLKLKLTRAIKPGSYKLVAAGTGADGRRAVAMRSIRVRR